MRNQISSDEVAERTRLTMTIKQFFAPLRLPFTGRLPTIPYYLKALLLSGIRLVILSLWGAFIYMLSRGRIGIAVVVFVIGMIFSAFKAIDLGIVWLTYVCYLAEAIQFLVSLYVGWRVARAASRVKYVEEIELIDEKGQLIKTFQQPISPPGKS